MKQDELLTIRHLSDLARRAYDGNYYEYTEFLSPAEGALLSELSCGYSLWGGYDGAERKLCAFGSEDAFGYPPSFPGVWIAIAPLSQKFAEQLSHRDVLGSLMGLGIRREVLGDILLSDNVAYLFALDKMADYLVEALTKVRHTNVSCRVVPSPPISTVALPDETVLVTAGERLDAFVASVYKLSRAESASLVEKGLVAIDGKVVEKGSVSPPAPSMISVRGYGRFRYEGIAGDTRKGKLRITVRIY